MHKTDEFIESYRKRCVESLFGMTTFQNCWPVWRAEMEGMTDGFRDAQAIYGLGSHLSAIFALTGETGRGQSSVSGGGAAWEGLVCWYLNLVLTGTRAVAAKQSKLTVPQCIRDAAAVVYGNYQTNTESDLSILVLPHAFDLQQSDFDLAVLDAKLRASFHEAELHIVQCKTNWNDNAQIPMLWDMIYSGQKFQNNRVKIGMEGSSIRNLKGFSYSFVTVPSQSKAIKAGSMAVHRVQSLSGGNFWGRPTKPGVALGLHEIFGRVLESAFTSTVQAHIEKCIQNGPRPFIGPK
jgi:hypothetical protein